MIRLFSFEFGFVLGVMDLGMIEIVFVFGVYRCLNYEIDGK